MADYYQSDGGSEPSDQTESSKDDSEMQETALVPSSIFDEDCKVGDKYTVEVVSKHESELEIKHVRKKKDEDKNDKDDREDHDDAHASIDRDIAKMGMGM